MNQAAPAFLPEPDPPKPAPQHTTRRTLILWMLLVGMFVGIWQLLNTAPSGHSPRLPACEPAPATWASAVPMLVPLVAVALFFGWLQRIYGVVADFNGSEEPGLRAHAERHFVEAAKIHSTVAARAAHRPVFRAAALFAQAHAQLWAGQLQEAIGALTDVERTFGLPRCNGVRVRVAVDLVLLNALLGDLEVAESWRQEARKRLAATRENRLPPGSMLCLGEAALALRRGRASEALTTLETNWLVMRDTLTANQMSLAEVLRAFAVSMDRQPNLRSSKTPVVETPTAVAGEFAFLGATWSEIRPFLRANPRPDVDPTS